MKIRIRKLEKKELAIRYGKSIKLVLVCLYWFGVEIRWGNFSVFGFIDSEIKRIDGINADREMAMKNSENKCPVCGEPLGTTGVRAVKKYHRGCRTQARKMERKNAKKTR